MWLSISKPRASVSAGLSSAPGPEAPGLTSPRATATVSEGGNCAVRAWLAPCVTRIQAARGPEAPGSTIAGWKASTTIDVPIFSEPSTNPDYRDATFPGGQDPIELGLDPATPITFDLTADQPDNRVFDTEGNLIRHIGALESNGAGGAILRAYGDMKRHDMGHQLAESIDEAGTGASVFLTENLWGVGVTAPYLHDGRATTLTEAILWHNGEALGARLAFEGSSHDDQAALIAFLENMVIFLPGE